MAKFSRAEHALKFAQNVIQFKEEGTMLFKQGEFSRALAAYQTALGSHPCRETEARLHFNIALTHQGMPAHVHSDVLAALGKALAADKHLTEVIEGIPGESVVSTRRLSRDNLI